MCLYPFVPKINGGASSPACQKVHVCLQSRLGPSSRYTGTPVGSKYMLLTLNPKPYKPTWTLWEKTASKHCLVQITDKKKKLIRVATAITLGLTVGLGV